jgi:uncharacterized delta-60 repeat protein
MADNGFYDVVLAAEGETIISQAGQLITTPATYADNFCLDRTFTPRFEAPGAKVCSVAADRDTGRYYVVGDFTTIAGVPRDYLARFNADGTIDPSFAPRIETPLTSVLVEPDGAIIVGGGLITNEVTYRRGVARLLPDGSIDRSFGNSAGVDSAVLFLGCQSDGSILVGGNFTRFNGRSCGTPLIRLTADGFRDTNFVAPANLGTVESFVIDQKDRVLLRAPRAGSPLVRLRSGGTIDPDFTTSPALGSASHFGVLSDNRPVAILSSTKRLVRFNTDGTIDPSFDLKLGITSTSYISSFYVDAEDRIVIGGKITYVGDASHPCSYLVRIKIDGSIDETFNPAADQYLIYALGELPAGKLLAGGKFTTWGVNGTSGLVTLGTNGSLNTASPPGFRVPTYSITTAIPAPGGKWLVAGGFTHVNGASANSLARLLPDGGLDPGFSAPEGLPAPSQLLRQGDGRILVMCEKSSTWQLQRLDEDGSSDPTFIGLSIPQSQAPPVELSPDGSIVTGGADTGVLQYSSDGNLIRGYGQGGNVSAIGIYADGRILAAGRIPGAFGNCPLVRYLPEGSVDATFIPSSGSLDSRTHILVEPNGSILLSGAWSVFDKMEANCFVRLHPEGTVALAGDVSEVAGTAITSMAPQSNGKILLSGMFQPTQRQWTCLRRLNADGSNDATFGAPNLVLAVGDTPSSVQFDDAGNLVLTGVVDVQQYGLARLKPGTPLEPSISAPPQPTPIRIGGAAELRVEATGANLHYVWFKNGIKIPDNDSAALGFPVASPDDHAIYNVEVYNSFGSVISRGAELVITEDEFILYGAWAYAAFGTSSEDYARPTEDPEGDGVTNLEHYAFNVPVGHGYIAGVIPRIISDNGMDYLAIQYPRKADALDLVYHVEASSDLISWEEVGTASRGSASSVSNIDSVPVTAESRRFMRVRVDYLGP